MACPGFAAAGLPEQNAFDVAIDNGGGFAKGDTGDCCRSVRADTRQLAECGRRLWQVSVVFGNDNFGPFMQKSRPAVIAKTAPGSEDFVFGCGGEGFNRRETGHPVSVMVEHGGDAGLLEHNFGDPDGVGVASAAPRKVPFLDAEPG